MDKTIQDPIHGLIKLEKDLLQLIDTPQFQRLRNIKQLGFAHLVYPGANHTRFEHSIGSMHLADVLTKRLGLDKEVVISALLHDIAHLPFSHSGERLLKNYTISHENIEMAIKGELKDFLSSLGFSVRDVKKFVTGEVDSIVCGDVDVDRMDYLVRDSYYTGVAYGIFDISRLIDKIKFDNGVIVEEGGIRAVESMLISRFLMYPSVYYHHVCRIATKMFERAMERIMEKDVKLEELFEMDDCDAMMLLKNHEPEFYSMLRNRRLFKRAIYLGRDNIDLREIRNIKEREAEKKIAKMAGIDEKYVIVDIPELEVFGESKVRVEINGGIKRIEEVSPIVRALRSSWIENWKLGIYTKKEFIEEVKRSAIEYLEIDKRIQKNLF
ncbi:MAG: HD domain-containing protein [Archaeoglobaceae archaeon]|nr:HD domain-containing protein [Archaeoglobaceae archaeon]